MSDGVHVLSDDRGNLFAVPHDLLEQAQVPPELTAKVRAAVGGEVEGQDIQNAVPLLSSWAAGKGPDDGGGKPPKDELTQVGTDLAAGKGPDDGGGKPPKDELTQVGTDLAAGKGPDDGGGKPPKDELTQIGGGPGGVHAGKGPDDGGGKPPKLDAETLNLRSLGLVQLRAQALAGGARVK
jgi:hypothetical protein